MSDYYKANRTKNIFDPKSDQAFKISRSKLEKCIVVCQVGTVKSAFTISRIKRV